MSWILPTAVPLDRPARMVLRFNDAMSRAERRKELRRQNNRKHVQTGLSRYQRWAVNNKDKITANDRRRQKTDKRRDYMRRYMRWYRAQAKRVLE